MNDSFEDRLGRSLIEIVPEQPTGDLAGAARTWARRARRRRQGIVVGAAAVAVLAAVGVPWAVTRGDGGESAPKPVDKPKLAQLKCPAKIDRGTLPGEPGKPLAKGAVRAVLCPANDRVGDFQAPRDVLETGLDSLVRLVNTEQVLPSSSPCTADDGIAWTVLLEYADGKVASVTGENYGCGWLNLGPHELLSGDEREGAREVYRKYLGLLAAQRETREPPGAKVPLSCSASGSPAWDDPKALGLTHGMLCWKTETLSNTPYQSVPLDDDLVALIDADIADRSTRRQNDPGGAECNDPLRVEIVAQNGWGDRMRVSGYGCGLFGGDDWYWRPSAKVQERLDELIEANPEAEIPPPTAADKPDDVVRAWADLLKRGERAKAGSLWAVDPTLPSAGATQVGFKDSTYRRVDPEPGTPAAAYSQVVVMTDAYYWETPEDVRDVDITIVRDSSDQPWQILEVTDTGEASVGR